MKPSKSIRKIKLVSLKLSLDRTLDIESSILLILKPNIHKAKYSQSKIFSKQTEYPFARRLSDRSGVFSVYWFRCRATSQALPSVPPSVLTLFVSIQRLVLFRNKSGIMTFQSRRPLLCNSLVKPTGRMCVWSCTRF